MFPQRFIDKYVQTADGCWLWTGATSRIGYGHYYYEGKPQLAHRAAYAMCAGAMPTPGMKVCHRCDNRACVNPDHLFLATQLENVRDMISKGRSHKRGLHGEGNPRARLTREQVAYIREGGQSGRSLAEKFGVAESTISMVRRGHNWRAA